MNEFITPPRRIDIPMKGRADRFIELAEQNWSRHKSLLLAQIEGIDLNDDHWEVILYLRKRYLLVGFPAYFREVQNDLNQHFLTRGGANFLSNLFPKGSATQGSRIANIPVEPYGNNQSS